MVSESFSQLKVNAPSNPAGLEAEQEKSVLLPMKTSLSTGGRIIFSSYNIASFDATVTVYLSYISLSGHVQDCLINNRNPFTAIKNVDNFLLICSYFNKHIKYMIETLTSSLYFDSHARF